MEAICSQLEIRGTTTVERYAVHPNTFDVATLQGNINYFIFDIESEAESDRFFNKIELLISRSTVCIAIGNHDSLVFASKCHAAGIHYIYYHPEQFSALGAIFDNETGILKTARSAIKISVLGCKGGVGNSSLSYHLASNLVKQRNSTLLLVQGLGGTLNLDLIAKKEIGSEVTKLQENLYALYEQREHRWAFSLPLYDGYDFVLFDHTLYNAETSELENALQHSNCVILVCNHDLAAIRNAKKLIDYHQHAQGSLSRVRKIVICFNQNQPMMSGAINQEEVASLLGRPVDIVIPFIKGNGDPANPLSFSGKHNAILQQLTNLTLGRNSPSSEAGKAFNWFGLTARKQ
ncbi:AAA family ATPase [Paramixta manurensis]